MSDLLVRTVFLLLPLPFILLAYLTLLILPHHLKGFITKNLCNSVEKKSFLAAYKGSCKM